MGVLLFKSEEHPRIAKWNKSLKWVNDLILGNGLITFSKFPIIFHTTQVKTFSRHTAREEFFTRKGAIFCEVQVPGIGKVNCINAHLGSIDFEKERTGTTKNKKLNSFYK